MDTTQSTNMSGAMVKYITGVSAIGTVNLGVLNTVSLAVFNLPITVPIMATAGAMLSFAYDDDDGKKTKLTKKTVVKLVIANTLITTAAVCVLPEIMGWEWYNPKLQGSLALLLSASARFVIPIFIKLLPEVARKWLKVGEYKVVKVPEEPEATNDEAK